MAFERTEQEVVRVPRRLYQHYGKEVYEVMIFAEVEKERKRRAEDKGVPYLPKFSSPVVVEFYISREVQDTILDTVDEAFVCFKFLNEPIRLYRVRTPDNQKLSGAEFSKFISLVFSPDMINYYILELERTSTPVLEMSERLTETNEALAMMEELQRETT